MNTAKILSYKIRLNAGSGEYCGRAKVEIDTYQFRCTIARCKTPSEAVESLDKKIAELLKRFLAELN